MEASSKQTSSRFVILHHTSAESEHWDLMLEHHDGLLTWQLSAEPIERNSLPIAARRIADHRKAYLDYEGPISRDRGEVRRVDCGDVELETLDADRCVFRLAGGRLTGRFSLVAVGTEWTLARCDDTERFPA